MGLQDRATAVVGQGMVYEDQIDIRFHSPGDVGPHNYRVELHSVMQYIVASQGEDDIDLVTLDRNAGLVRIKLWPTQDYVYYVECAVNPNPDGTLIWGARMGATPPVHSQKAIRTTVEGRPVQYFVTPPFSASPDGTGEFWFTMQDGTEGHWNLVDSISLVLFTRG